MNKFLTSKKYLTLSAIICSLVLFACVQQNNNIEEVASEIAAMNKANNPTNTWFVGGTLHAQDALAWQKASYQDKRATCSDFITAMHIQKMLTPSLLSYDFTPEEVQPLSEELVALINNEYNSHDNSQQNTTQLKGKKISETTIALASQKGWLSKHY